MNFIIKHKVWFIAAAVLFLVLLFWPEGAQSSDFGITYIASGRMTEADFSHLTGEMCDALKTVPGYENANVNIDEIAIMPDEGSGRQNALARLLYGDGVIYIADYSLVRSIVDDDGLFAPLPKELEGDIFGADKKAVAKSLKSFGDLSLSRDYEGLCVFIRSSETEDKELSRYMSENYDAACEVLMKIEKN